jgi:dTDP-4-dehydrorhamnose 3,5-epimerase
MNFHRTKFDGLLCLEPKVHADNRGDFVKTFHDGLFRDFGVTFKIREEFFSTSGKDVLRGMHFQVPPADHAKLIYCIKGAVLDVVVDLRRSSSTYGQVHAEELSEVRRNAVFIPSGFAHGFLALTSESVMIYKTDAVYAPQCDAGIRWDSFGFRWGTTAPILSERDACLPLLLDFTSPF